jgi:hypothetical protein
VSSTQALANEHDDNEEETDTFANIYYEREDDTESDDPSDTSFEEAHAEYDLQEKVDRFRDSIIYDALLGEAYNIQALYDGDYDDRDNTELYAHLDQEESNLNDPSLFGA